MLATRSKSTTSRLMQCLETVSQLRKLHSKQHSPQATQYTPRSLWTAQHTKHRPLTAQISVLSLQVRLGPAHSLHRIQWQAAHKGLTRQD